MGDNMVYTLSVDKKTGQLAVQQKQIQQRQEKADPVQELRRIMEQQHNARKFTLIFLLCLGIVFPIMLFNNVHGYFVLAIIILALILCGVYLVSYHYDHKTVAHVVDTHREIEQTRNRTEPEQNGTNELTDERVDKKLKHRESKKNF